MELAQFLKPASAASATQSKIAPAVKSTPESVEPQNGEGGERGVRGAAAGGERENPGGDSATVYRDTTPSGIVVEYSPGDGTKENPRWYKVNGEEVPSVTTVLDVLRKDGLSWWGMKVGVEGVLELFYRGRLTTVLNWKDGEQAPHIVEKDGVTNEATSATIVSALTSEKLTVNHALNRAGDRGTNVHSALEAWASSKGEFFPTPQNFPDEERPYVEGLLKFIDDCDGAVIPVAHEVMVGSAEHGFAGRFDLIVEIRETRQFVRKMYKRKDSLLWAPKPGRWRLDLKTSSGVYDSYHLQLAGYEGASIEGGYPPCRGGAILRVDKAGHYELVPSDATFDQFLAVKSAYDALKGLKA